MNRECECCPAMEGCNIAIQPGSAMCTIRKMQSGKTKGDESKECGIDKKTLGIRLKRKKWIAIRLFCQNLSSNGFG